MKKKCLHCGYSWTPRIETEPKACPQCKSPRWAEEPRKAGRPRGEYGMRVRGVVQSRHMTENAALAALRRHNRATKGSALYADIGRMDGDKIIAIGHDNGDGLEWYEVSARRQPEKMEMKR
jgi:hypothetical protein